MNNSAFRSMVANPSRRDDGGTSATPPSTFKKPTLGSRARSSIPMTPRNVPGFNANREFARQVAERTSSSSEPPLKKFKSSAAPKGTKLGAGYVDRAQLRHGEDKSDGNGTDKATRLKNLEEQLKLGQIDQAQFETQRSQIGVGGDVSSTHLVKGLDWKLLERVRRGEDVSQSAQSEDGDGEQHVTGVTDVDVDVDEALEQALEKEIVARQMNDDDDDTQEQVEAPQQVLTRDEILRCLKEQRNNPAMPGPPVLNDKFKKVASTEKPGRRKFTESVNGRRREVLIVTNKDGTTKRKTRWLDPDDATQPEQQPLGMAVPEELVAKQKALLEAESAVDDSEDIFADAGDDYDPLANIGSDDEDSDGDQKKHDETQPQTDIAVTNQKRDYFSSTKGESDEPVHDNSIAHDPAILAALKRAAEIRKREEEVEHQTGSTSTNQADLGGEAKSSAFLAKLKESERRDAADFDYGFGESRFGDDDDDDQDTTVLHNGHDGEKKSGGRKRGPKKRKGDKDNVQDVMSVLQGRNKKS